jgi:hypothetical protein
MELLENRQLLSANVLRIASYNMEADINGDTTPLPGFYADLEGIGEEKVQGNLRPVDIVTLQETTSNSTTVAPIVTNLNSYYNGAAVYAQSSYQATQSGGNTGGNGPNAMIYNTLTLRLLASVGVGTPEGSTNGEYRQVVRYEFQSLADSGATGVFYVYVSHMKSGTTSADINDRAEESTIIRNNEATLPANSSVLYTGDLNSNYPEQEFINFEASGQGQAFDPESNSDAVTYWSESSTDLRYRDDYELYTSNVSGGTGNINYVSGSFHVFANNGTTPSGGSVNSGSDTALNSDLFQDGGTFISASTLYSDLTTGSDHLPAVADYTFTVSGTPSIGAFAASPNTVASGSSSTLTASSVTDTGSTITGVNFYRESNSTAGLQTGGTTPDTLLGAGTQSGTSWSISTSTSGLGAGTYTYYAVATDASGVSTSPSSATLTVTSVPTIGLFSVNPDPVTLGGAVTLSAESVEDAGSTVTTVAFYLESNGTGGLQVGSDTFIGEGSQNGSNWTVTTTANDSTPGVYTYYAVATDAAGVATTPASVTSTVVPFALPCWVSGTNATWTPSTGTLDVTGPGVSINEDPGADTQSIGGDVVTEPNIVVEAGQSLEIKPTATPSSVATPTYVAPMDGQLVRLGGLTVHGTVLVDSLGAARTHSNHIVLVLGTSAGAAPTFSVTPIASAKIDLQDNDMIVHSGSLSAVQALAAQGRQALTGVLDGTWTGTGLTSSTAAAVDAAAGYEETVLAVALNSDQILGVDSAWQVGSASEPLNGSDVIVKYTYNGDAALEGFVGDDSVTLVNGFYDTGASQQNDWVFGSFTGSGTVNDDDVTILNGLYGNGMAGSGLPQL